MQAFLYFAASASELVKNSADKSCVGGNCGPDLSSVISSVSTTLLWVIGVAAVLAIIYGSFQMITSQGDPAKIKTGRMTITYAVIGLIVAVASYAIVAFVAARVGGGSAGSVRSSAVGSSSGPGSRQVAASQVTVLENAESKLVAQSVPMPTFALGAEFNPEPVSKVQALAFVPVPVSVDLTRYAVRPGDQGQVGSCVAWAIGYSMMGMYANTQSRAGSPFAPMYLYSQIHFTNEPSGGGSTGQAAYKVLTEQGIASQSLYIQGNFDWHSLPTTAEKADAAGHKAIRPRAITGAAASQGVKKNISVKGSSDNGRHPNPVPSNENVKYEFQQALATGHPVSLTMAVFPSFFWLNPQHSVYTTNDVFGDAVGNHEVVAVGYNATGLVIENSWGAGWGNGGFATLGWDFVSAYVADGTIIDGFAPLPVPSVSSLAPTTLKLAGGNLTILGNGFADTSIKAMVAGPTGKSAVVKVVSESTNQLVLTMPPEPAGTSKLTVTTPYGKVIRNVVYKK